MNSPLREPRQPKPEDFRLTQEVVDAFEAAASLPDDPLYERIFSALAVCFWVLVVCRALWSFAWDKDWVSFFVSIASLPILFMVFLPLWMLPLAVVTCAVAGVVRWVSPEFMKPKPPPPQIMAFQQAQRQYREDLEQYEQREREREALERRREQTRRLRELDHLKQMHPSGFERLVAEAYRRLGYEVRETPASGDGGIDGHLTKDGKKYLLQCKRYAKPVGEPTIRDLLGTVIFNGADGGIVVTTSSFSDPARTFVRAAKERVEIQLVDGQQLIDMLGQAFPESSPVPERLLPLDELRHELREQALGEPRAAIEDEVRDEQCEGLKRSPEGKQGLLFQARVARRARLLRAREQTSSSQTKTSPTEGDTKSCGEGPTLFEPKQRPKAPESVRPWVVDQPFSTTKPKRTRLQAAQQSIRPQVVEKIAAAMRKQKGLPENSAPAPARPASPQSMRPAPHKTQSE